jgi:diketogulonate reductase-like aldo/keto reductase
MRVHRQCRTPFIAAAACAHQVALRWIWQHGVAVTTKSSNVAHLQEDRDIFGWELSDAEMSDADASDTPPGSPSFMCSS